MARRGRIKIRPILVTLNVLVLLIVIGFYTFRLVKYYFIENGKKDTDEKIYLIDTVTKKQSYVDLTNGLVFDEEKNVYTYKGEVKDNYLVYSGITYRIVGIDNENNIKAVSDNSVTLMYSGLEKGYNNSYVNKWLNKTDAKYSGIYENTLYSSETLLSNTYLCDDNIEELTSITCDKNNNDNKITLLSLYDYFEAGGKESYLNNKEQFYLSSTNAEGDNYFVTTDGEIGLNNITTKVYGVRPVITINSKTELISGSGSKSNPYTIEHHEKKIAKNLYVGDIVSLSDTNYKVVELSDTKIKVASVISLVDENKNQITKAFNSSSNKYSVSSGVGLYLTKTYLPTIKETSILASDNWYIGDISLSNLDYATKYTSKVNSKVGMLTIGDLFIGEVKNVFTISRGLESSRIINVINEDGNVFGDFVSSKYGIRPALYIDSNATISKGEGTLSSPYILGEVNETKEN